MPEQGTLVYVWNYYINGGSAVNCNEQVIDLTLEETLTSFRVAITNPSSNILSGGTIHCTLKILGVNEKIEELENDINSLQSGVTGIESDIVEINDKIEVSDKYEYNKLPLSGSSDGLAKKSVTVGKSYNSDIGGQGSYCHCSVAATEGDLFKVEITQGTSSNYPYYIHLVDANDIVLERYAPALSAASANLQEYSISITNPLCVKMYVGAYSQLQFISTNINIQKQVKLSLQEQIDKLSYGIENLDGLEKPSIQGIQGEASSKGLMDYNLKTFETGIINNMITRVNDSSTGKNPNHNFINILFITDTHQGGNYLQRGDTSERAIAIYNRLMVNSIIDASAHCGDLSTEYGKGRKTLSELTKYARDMFTTYNPLIVTKGNHDYNSDIYVEANLADLDWDNETYYILDLSSPQKSNRLYNFVTITQEQWDRVTPLYTQATNAERCITDKMFKKLAQYNTPTGAVYDSEYPDGGYFYIDYDTYKIRLICLNNFMMDDSYDLNKTELVGKQFSWLTSQALNLSGKTTPNQWCALTIGHLAIDSYDVAFKQTMIDIVTAFMSGTSISGTYGGISYSHDFSTQGASKFIGNIHGHMHSYTYSNSNGFNDIGLRNAFVDYSYIGQNVGYTIDIISIDTQNRKIYDTSSLLNDQGEPTYDRVFDF